MTAKLTAARERALHVLSGGSARVSNVTLRRGDGPVRLVYWQCADWLVDNGLAVKASPVAWQLPTTEIIEITPAGLAALERQGQ